MSSPTFCVPSFPFLHVRDRMHQQASELRLALERSSANFREQLKLCGVLADVGGRLGAGRSKCRTVGVVRGRLRSLIIREFAWVPMGDRLLRHLANLLSAGFCVAGVLKSFRVSSSAHCLRTCTAPIGLSRPRRRGVGARIRDVSPLAWGRCLLQHSQLWPMQRAHGLTRSA